MASELKTNTAVTVCVGPFFDKTDGVTPETGLTVANCKITAIAETDDNSAPTIILDNVAGNDATNTLTHISGDDAGYYSLKLTAANVNRLGRFKVAIVDAANHCPVFHEYEIVTANAYDSKYSTANRQVDVIALSGDTTAADNCEAFFDGTGYVGGTAKLTVDVAKISGDATAADNSEAFFDGTGYAGTNNVIPLVTTTTTATNLTNLPAAAATAAELAKVPKSDSTVSWNATALAAIQSECNDALTATVADSVPSDGTRPSVAQGILMLTRLLMEKSVSGTTVTVKKEDGSTTSMTFTLNDATSPTGITRAS